MLIGPTKNALEWSGAFQGGAAWFQRLALLSWFCVLKGCLKVILITHTAVASKMEGQYKPKPPHPIKWKWKTPAHTVILCYSF